MTSELSIFAARLREHIAICADEFSRMDAPGPAWLKHVDAEFNGLGVMLFALQFKYNAPYRKICEARGLTPDKVTHWKQIPVVPTAAFKEFEFTSLLPERRTHVFHSSGTTQQRPSRHFHNAESLAMYEASLWPWLWDNCRVQSAECGVLCLTPSPRQAPHSSLVYMFDFARQKLGASEEVFFGRVGNDGAWTLELDSLVSALAQTDGKPRFVLGTAFSFVHLLDAMVERNLKLKLPDGSRVMETGGYKGRSREMPKEELHRLITEQLGVSKENILCEYGMSELSSQAYDNAARHFRFPPWARAQIISPETEREAGEGKTGVIRVFDLANVFSVMAIQTEDLAVRRGDGFELIGRASLAEPRGCSLMAV